MGERVVVMVSGGDSVTPFTTNDAACASGLAAGMTLTQLRESFITAGFKVFTAPVMNGRGPVVDPEPSSFGAFGEQPEVLPAELTINSVADIDLGGEHLARFLIWLAESHGAREIALLGHSNGGLFARSGLRVLRDTDESVRVRKLITLGTPWLGAIPTRVAVGELDASVCGDDAFFASFLPAATARIKEGDQGLAHTNTVGYLQGPNGWNAAQRGVLDQVDALLIGGTYLRTGADPTIWPNDGIVPEFSALATDIDPRIVPNATRASYPVTHSIFISHLLQLDWQTAMTWNSDVINTAIDFASA
jgi:pimeloyl-ACP methyl ester carboxylesterase